VDVCSLRTDDLDSCAPPAVVLAALAAEPGLACLWGNWAGQPTVLIMSRPLAVSAELAALDQQPSLREAPAAGLIGGGWVGWLGYDAPHQLAYYDHLLRWSPEHRRWSFEALWSSARSAELARRREYFRTVLADPAASGPPATTGEFSGPDHAGHLAAVEQAIGLIRDGEIYQVNVCTRLAADFSGNAVRLFADAVTSLQPAYGAFLTGTDRTVLSFSPELFLRREGLDVRTSPIKGTWAREEGGDGAQRLRDSAKDVAENVMIVDLVRNDLGRVCRPGTVRASELLQVHPHPGVWHLVSTVQGTLREGVGDAQLLAATFPPGSVTGAPKLRAMEVIDDLEPHARGVYTGAIGIAGPSIGLALSVAIRTFEIAAGRIELGVGGGVTVDSVPELEWRECVQKAAPLLTAIGASASAGAGFVANTGRPQTWQREGGLIETMLAVDARVLRLEDHLARLARSSAELYGTRLSPDLAERVRAQVAGTSGRWAVRVVVKPGAEVSVVAAPALARPASSQVTVRRREPGVWRHKWADRSWIESAESAAAQPLYVAADGCVLETSRGNVFVLRTDGVLMTPPLRDDLLPGVTRGAVLDRARAGAQPVELREFGLSALVEAAAVFWTSSLSGLVPITALDGRPLRTRASEQVLSALAAALIVS
jgi:para-aminobenzoate synthetase/4-amino-4-deoxychorismate lyase